MATKQVTSVFRSLSGTELNLHFSPWKHQQVSEPFVFLETFLVSEVLTEVQGIGRQVGRAKTRRHFYTSPQVKLAFGGYSFAGIVISWQSFVINEKEMCFKLATELKHF